jgi:hypothetical protein
MNKNTALLWYLLAEAAEWATKQQRETDKLAAVANDARAQCAQYDPNNAPVIHHLAKGLVEALASPDRRGLTGFLDDIKSEIGETPPVWGDVKTALQDMCNHIESGGERFDQASKVVRFYLTRPIERG